MNDDCSGRVLFLCTGNYYRSRFAEILFNHLARQSGLKWTAFSRALAVELGSCNVGPISVHTRKECATRGIVIPDPIPFPRGVERGDFLAAQRIIALKEAEHRGYLQRRFPQWLERVEFWHVDDLDASEPAEACAQIERNVAALVAGMGAGRGAA